jgi:hypothetical protein
VNDEHCPLKLRANLFQILADLIAVLGVVHHHEQHRLFAHGLMLCIALPPLLDA